MKNYFLPLFFLFSSLAFAQKKVVLNNKSLLWLISSKDMKKPSYLFGTIHLICPKDYVWTDLMKTSFKNAEEVCFEMDMDNPNLMMEVAMGLINTTGKQLKDYFSPQDYDKLSHYLSDSMHISIEQFAQLKPVALETMFTTTNTTCSTPVSYEENLTLEAQRQHKEIHGLETVSEQLDLFDNLPLDSVINDIMSMVNGRNDGTEEYNKLIAAYKKQDLPALYKYIKESGELDKDLPGFLDVRNEKWIPRMTEMMDAHSMFFAVGAGHLYGENGLIELLRKAGYNLTPIR